MKRDAGVWTARRVAIGLSALGLLCTGCPNPNTYTTPRTNDPGKISHSIAVEGYGFSVGDDDGDRYSATVPTLPTYALRVGLAERLDLGTRFSNGGSTSRSLPTTRDARAPPRRTSFT